MIRRLLRHPAAWLATVLLAATAAAGLYWFQPWRLFTSTEVREALPEVAAPGTGSPSLGPGSPSPGPGSPSPGAGGTRAAPANELLAAGRFVTHEHDTSGEAQLVRGTDGRLRLVLRDLDTSDGPDLRVWLTDQPVRSGTAGWRVFDDGRWVELGRLKGNKGDQVYALPAGVDPADYRSVSIWCKRFAVSFGAAELRAA